MTFEINKAFTQNSTVPLVVALAVVLIVALALAVALAAVLASNSNSKMHRPEN